MNGILLISLNSGMLIHHNMYKLNFGFNTNIGHNELQLSSILFALYRMSYENDNDTSNSLVSITLGCNYISFKQLDNQKILEPLLLITLIDSELSIETAEIIIANLINLMNDIEITLPLKPSIIKQINRQLQDIYSSIIDKMLIKMGLSSNHVDNRVNNLYLIYQNIDISRDTMNKINNISNTENTNKVNTLVYNGINNNTINNNRTISSSSINNHVTIADNLLFRLFKNLFIRIFKNNSVLPMSDNAIDNHFSSTKSNQNNKEADNGSIEYSRKYKYISFPHQQIIIDQFQNKANHRQVYVLIDYINNQLSSMLLQDNMINTLEPKRIIGHIPLQVTGNTSTVKIHDEFDDINISNQNFNVDEIRNGSMVINSPDNNKCDNKKMYKNINKNIDKTISNNNTKSMNNNQIYDVITNEDIVIIFNQQEYNYNDQTVDHNNHHHHHIINNINNNHHNNNVYNTRHFQDFLIVIHNFMKYNLCSNIIQECSDQS